MTDQNKLPLDLEQSQRGLEILHQLRHIVTAAGLVGESMPAQVEGDDAVLHRKLL